MLVLFMHFLDIIRVHKYLSMLMYEGSNCHITKPLSSFVPLLAIACLPFSINSQNGDLVVSKRDNLAIDNCKYLNSSCWMPIGLYTTNEP